MNLEDCKRYTEWLGGWLVVGIAFNLLFGALVPTDSTDGGRLARSGLTLHVDAATGCEYLSSRHGGVTPRMNGRSQVGCRP